jgi:Sulfotransferase family
MLSPWKTASQTVRLRLAEYDESQYSIFFHYNPHLQRVVHQHITCAEFMCLPESKLAYHLASFVRNPYDRAYSGFRQLQKDLQIQPRATYPAPWIRNLVADQLEENFFQLCQAGFEFDAWIKLVREEQIYEIGRNTNFPLHPAHYWTHISGAQVVDFIGRVETFEADFAGLLKRLSVDEPLARNANVADMVRGSECNAFGYRYTHLMSAATISKINTLFVDDFLLFQYPRIKTS